MSRTSLNVRSGAAAVMLIASAASAVEYSDLRLSPDDAISGARFGCAVAVSGSTAIVGARDRQVISAGGAAGAAYLFDALTGVQIARLYPEDSALYDEFGTAVGIHGDTAIVGVRHDDDLGTDSGSAYLFSTTTGTRIGKLLADDGEDYDRFGSAVAVSDAYAVVGAPGDDVNGSGSGSVYLFDLSTGDQLARMIAADGAAGDAFGSSVAISGTTVIVGAPSDDDNGLQSGAAYVFSISLPIAPVQVHKIVPADNADHDYFGEHVDVSGLTAVISAALDDDNGNASGSAYLYHTGTGQQIVKLHAPDAAPNDQFGTSVAIHGQHVVVGARFDDPWGSDSGSGHLFNAATGEHVVKYIASHADVADKLGCAAGVSDIVAVFGALENDDDADNAGSAYSFFIPVACEGDADGDMDVDFDDLNLVLANWSMTVTPGQSGDVSGDGQVNFNDLNIVLGAWGAACR